MMQIAVLFARADSNYKQLPECDVWDAERDARNWPGGCQVVAHPPCRAWGRLRHFAKPRDDEKDLARFAVAQVRKWGGVLEHPERARSCGETKICRSLGNATNSAAGLCRCISSGSGTGRRKRRCCTWWVANRKRYRPCRWCFGMSDCVIRLDKRRADGTHIRKG